MPNRSQRGRKNNNPEGRNQYSSDWMNSVRDHPLTTAAAVGAAAAAGAFLWSKRDRIGESFSSGMDRLSEMKAQRMGRSQGEIGEEAMTLKETGKKTRGPRGPMAQQDIRAGVARSNQEMKAGAKALS